MTTSPTALGFSAERLARIDRFLAERYVDPGLLPCALFAVAREGRVVHRSVLGHASLERRQPLAEDTIFRIYSMTKPITSVAFMMLVEEGKVAIDDPVHRWIPAWRDLAVYRSGMPGAFVTRPVEAPMRIIDLLRHTSGLTYGFQLRTSVDAAYRSAKIDAFDANGLEPFIDALGKLPLEFSPGSAWNYSVSTDVLGYLVGLISGMPFDEFVRTRILRPLEWSTPISTCPPTRRGASPTATRNRLRAASRQQRRTTTGHRPARRRAAAAWSRPWPTTCASARCCARAARSATCAFSGRRR